ncbi:MAG: hypothetical protein R6U85_04645 [Salinivirgaceae bacterium]
MKIIKKGMHFSLVITLLLTLFSACVVEVNDDNDDNNGTVMGSGTATLDGSTSTFSQGIITYHGLYENSEFHTFDIAVGSSGINPIAQTGVGDALQLELLLSSSTFSGGRFVFSESETLAENTIILGYYLIGVDASTQEAEKLYMVKDGTLDVSKTGDNYELSYNFTVQELSTIFYLPIGDDKSLTGSYSGKLVYDDASAKSTSKLNTTS